MLSWRLASIPAKLPRAEVVPWELDENLYGIACTTAEGIEEGDPIGTKAEAQQLVEDINAQKGHRQTIVATARIWARTADAIDRHGDGRFRPAPEAQLVLLRGRFCVTSVG